MAETKLRLRTVNDEGTVMDWHGQRTRPQEQGVVCLDGWRTVGSLDWETTERFLSIENLWIDPEYRSSPVALRKLIGHLDRRYPDTPIIVGAFANPKVERLIAALNRRPARWAAARAL